jgi:hypothetical protein
MISIDDRYQSKKREREDLVIALVYLSLCLASFICLIFLEYSYWGLTSGDFFPVL